MGIADIKRQAASLREHYDKLPMTGALRAKVLVVYAKKTLLDLTTVLSNQEITQNLLEDFLTRHWELVNKTLLSPAAIPDEAITTLLCDVAAFLADVLFCLSPEQGRALIDSIDSHILVELYAYMPTRLEPLDNLLAFIKTAANTALAKQLAASVIDNDIKNIKASILSLAQDAISWRAWGYSFFTQKNPMDVFVRAINALAPKWKDRIKSALGLSDEISNETFHALINQNEGMWSFATS